MTRRLIQCLRAVLAAVLFLGAFRVAAHPANDSSRTTYDSFDVIARRNIFDPSPRIRPPAPVAPPTQDAVALVGTMSYSKGKFAFFDGTKTDYKKVLGPGAAIAGYTIREITQHDVTLAANGEKLTLTVGSQIPMTK